MVFVRRFGQLPLGSRVTVNGDGVLEFQANQRIGFLTINDSGVVTALTSTFELDHLTMMARPGLAGILEGKTGGAVVLHGHVTASGGFIRGNGTQGIPSLVLDGTHRFTVLDGGTLFLLDLRLFTEEPSMLIKDGPGTLSVVNQIDTYTGIVQVVAGTLLMNGIQNTSPVDLQGGVIGARRSPWS
jgi:autotransporter-associated beta strand protein